MTPIEQLAKDYRAFHGDSEAVEKAYLEGAKQARLQDIELIRSCSQYQTNPYSVLFENGYEEALEDAVYKIEELL